MGKRICGNCTSYMPCHGEEFHGTCAWDDEDTEYTSKACERYDDEGE